MSQPSLFEVDADAANAPAWDHAALAFLPITVADRSGMTGPLTIERQFPCDGKVKRVVITLTPGEGLELPSHADGQLLLALLQQSLGCDPPAERVETTLHTVLRVLGRTTGGVDYDRARDSLRRLYGLSLTVRSELRARDGRTYGRMEDASRIIQRYQVHEAGGLTVWWGQVVTAALVLNDFKRLDLPLYLRLSILAAQLYRLLDRVTLSGEASWSIGWQTLADLLGMASSAYARPARFRQVLEPHLAALEAEGVLESWEYQRGGTFLFHVRNPLRQKLREVLVERGVYPEAARQLVAGYDETKIMGQLDCLVHGDRRHAAETGGYLVKAVQENYELRYPEDEPEAFAALLGMLGEEERRLYRQAAVELTGVAAADDPRRWPVELRAVCRFLITHDLDPERLRG